MGPRSFDRGNPDDLADRMLDRKASMGPRSFDRGNGRMMSASNVSPSSFNGAAVF